MWDESSLNRLQMATTLMEIYHHTLWNRHQQVILALHVEDGRQMAATWFGRTSVDANRPLPWSGLWQVGPHDSYECDDIFHGGYTCQVGPLIYWACLEVRFAPFRIISPIFGRLFPAYKYTPTLVEMVRNKPYHYVGSFISFRLCRCWRHKMLH